MSDTLEQVVEKLANLDAKVRTFEQRTPATVLKSQVRLKPDAKHPRGQLIPGIIHRERVKARAAAKAAGRKKPGPVPGAAAAARKAEAAKSGK